MLELKRIPMIRIVALPSALDEADFADALSFRVAPDEVYVQTGVMPSLKDEHAIITKEASLAGVWLSSQDAHHFLEHECVWELPSERPAFAQGAVAHLPVKLYFEEGRVLIMTAAPYAYDLSERLKGFIR